MSCELQAGSSAVAVLDKVTNCALRGSRRGVQFCLPSSECFNVLDVWSYVCGFAGLDDRIEIARDDPEVLNRGEVQILQDVDLNLMGKGDEELGQTASLLGLGV